MSIKNSKPIQAVYNHTGIKDAYHFMWAWAGSIFAGHPSNDIFVIGVTGTKGKTTTLELISAILESGGKKTALLSSLREKIGDDSSKNAIGNSMPGRGYIQKFLRRAVDAGCGYAVIEVTSQGVAAHRHKFINWNLGAITNLAPEHIESHGSFENYREAKLSFLRSVLKNGGKVILNSDDQHFDFFKNILAGKKTMEVSRTDEGVKRFFPKSGQGEKFLISEFNEENMAIAIAIAKELGVPDSAIGQALRNFPGVPGRAEFVRVGGYTAVVDYAHTPDSLRAAYKAVKPAPSPSFPNPRLICVLGGAGGGRDRWKRPQMGAIAAEYCDEIILTDEDPYDEDPSAIVAEIESGIVGAGFSAEKVHKEIDRTKAIGEAVSLLREGDVVIGTGKGSEDWIHIAGGKRVPWNEKALFEKVLEEKNTPHPREKG